MPLMAAPLYWPYWKKQWRFPSRLQTPTGVSRICGSYGVCARRTMANGSERLERKRLVVFYHFELFFDGIQMNVIQNN